MAFEQEKARLREEICRAAHQIAQAGYVAANDGNLSARCPDGHILLTPTGVYKGDVTPELLLEMTLEGEVLRHGGLGPSSETPMHLAVYRRRKDIGGIVHTHSPFALCMASRGAGLTQPITADMVLLLGEIPCLPYLTLGSERLAEEVAQTAEHSRSVLLAHHGACTWGRDLREAWYRAQALEQTCKQFYLQTLLGGALPEIPPEETAKLIARREEGEKR